MSHFQGTETPLGETTRRPHRPGRLVAQVGPKAGVSTPAMPLSSATLPVMTMVGYARVSTDHQSLEAQRDALTGVGCERIFTDTLSGARDDRPGLTALLAYVRSGDAVVVTALDRLGRSLSAVIRTVEALTAAGVLLRSLREGIDYSTPTGRMLAGIFASLAEYERELMHERAAAARACCRPAAGPAHRAPNPPDRRPDPAGPGPARRGRDHRRPRQQLQRQPRHHLPRPSRHRARPRITHSGILIRAAGSLTP